MRGEHATATRGFAIGLALAAGACGGSQFRSGSDAGGAAPGVDGATPFTDAGADGTGVADAPRGPPASCNDVMARNPQLKNQNGAQAVVLPDGGALSVWCDMTTDRGGWTLVGRSVANQTSGFGWNAANGDVTDDAEPYSLGLTEHPIPFTEILIGARDAAKGWLPGGNVFKVTVPAGFVATYRTTALALAKPKAMVIGTCAPAPAQSGWMFNFAGRTEKGNDTFFFTDNDVSGADQGLHANGWGLAGPCCGSDACNRTADLEGRQGMIFVR